MPRQHPVDQSARCPKCQAVHAPTRILMGHPVRRCQAHSKRTKQQCGGCAEPNFEVCRMHGGKTPVGLASPSFQGKGFSKHAMPGLLQEAYEKAVNDPDLVSARDSLGIVEARIEQLLTALAKEPDSGFLWGNLRKWLDQGRKLRDTERKRLEAAQAYITSEKLMAMVATIVEILRRHVTDRAVLQQVLNDIQRLSGPAPQSSVPLLTNGAVVVDSPAIVTEE